VSVASPTFHVVCYVPLFLPQYRPRYHVRYGPACGHVRSHQPLSFGDIVLHSLCCIQPTLLGERCAFTVQPAGRRQPNNPFALEPNATARVAAIGSISVCLLCAPQVHQLFPVEPEVRSQLRSTLRSSAKTQPASLSLSLSRLRSLLSYSALHTAHTPNQYAYSHSPRSCCFAFALDGALSRLRGGLGALRPLASSLDLLRWCVCVLFVCVCGLYLSGGDRERELSRSRRPTPSARILIVSRPPRSRRRAFCFLSSCRCRCVCEHDAEYPPLDGTGNNLAHPSWGTPGSAYLSVLGKSSFADGLQQPWAGPNARLVSLQVLSSAAVVRGSVLLPLSPARALSRASDVSSSRRLVMAKERSWAPL